MTNPRPRVDAEQGGRAMKVHKGRWVEEGATDELAREPVSLRWCRTPTNHIGDRRVKVEI